MKKTISFLVLLLLFLVVSCKDKKAQLPEVYTTKKLDTVKYAFRKINHKKYPFGKEYHFGDTIVNFSNLEKEYVEHIYIGNTSYGYAYDKTTFLLRSEDKRLSSIELYVREYDRQGKLIKQTDYLEGYTFTPEQLATKMKRDFDVNVADAQFTHVISGKNFWGTPYYGVRVLDGGNGYREIRINGKTGEFMGEDTGQYEE